jgi:hypothetical protein
MGLRRTEREVTSYLRERFRDEQSMSEQIHRALAQSRALTEAWSESPEDGDEEIVGRVDRGSDLIDNVRREGRGFASLKTRQLGTVGGVPSEPAVSHGGL